MVAKGSYTPKSGALAGATFPSYYQYQNARAQERGFGSYAEERRMSGIGNPLVRFMIDRAVHGPAGMTRKDATDSVRAWYQAQPYKGPSLRAGDPSYSTAQGARKRAALIYMYNHGIDLTPDEKDTEVPY